MAEHPVYISYRHMEPSEAIEEVIKEKAEKLFRLYDRLIHCRVVVEAPHRHHKKGNIYHVKIELGVPGHPDLVINREAEENHAHEDVYVAIRDAFATARRVLKQHVEKMRSS